ncbi:MAG: hypothetical protein ACLRSE_02220 [Alistipes finegoldii]
MNKTIRCGLLLTAVTLSCNGGVRPAAHVIHQQLRPKGRNPEAWMRRRA